MPERGLEPPPSYLDKNLNLARLPIPPLGQVRPLVANHPRCYQPGLATQGRPDDAQRYSTVTLLARFRGLSTSQPRRTAMW